MTSTQIAVVIPCYRVHQKVLGVLAGIGPDVSQIYVVDDACPQSTGDLVEREVHDPRVKVIRRPRNGGVGAATMTGMEAAAEQGADIIVKLDGDGQMDPALISKLVRPILRGHADYVKGNRFFSPELVQGMPAPRLAGNGALSLLSKLSSGYWSIFDPTNGFVAIHAAVFSLLPRQKIANDFFFESDLLFRLNLLRARVVDMPMRAVYADEKSNLRIRSVVGPFLWKHLRNLIKRITYSYFIRDFGVGSLYLTFGIPLVLFSLGFGGYQWLHHARLEIESSAGTVMLAALPFIIGFQLLLSFLALDIASVPATPIFPQLQESDES
jgi:glycosyltransferase involved in cell wall biosynthesis